MDKHIISTSSTLLQALQKLNDLSGQVMTLFAVDGAGVLRGTITDGDVRRALLGGATLESSVEGAMHRNFRALTGNACEVSQIRRYRQGGIRLLPRLNPDGTIREVLDLGKQHTSLPLSAILMAGGIGERLRPLTLDTPKPLLKIGDKSIIDYNIDALAACGITEIYVSIRYLADKMRAHLAQRMHPAVKCIEEQSPLGTIGSAALAHLPADGYSIVMNSDLLTTIQFEDMYLHHLSEHADITIAAIPYQVSVPYAILDIDEADSSRVTGIKEKPSYSYFANAGIYIMPNHLLRDLPLDRRTDATDLIEQAIAKGLRVTYFPINGTWIDIGSPADFKQATELMKTLKGFNL